MRIGPYALDNPWILAPMAAEDACVRQQALEHEAAHTRAVNEVVDRFIEQQKFNLQRGMASLKETPAPNEEIAKARWETGLRAIVAAAKQQLLEGIRSGAINGDPELAKKFSGQRGRSARWHAEDGRLEIDMEDTLIDPRDGKVAKKTVVLATSLGD